MTAAARPRREVTLEAFVWGLLAALALKGRPTIRADAGVLDRALAGTLHDAAKAAERARMRFAFRLGEDALARPRSALAAALAEARRRGWIVARPGPPPEYEIVLGREEAVAVLDRVGVPLELLERAANAFRRRQEMAKIRALASRRTWTPGP